MDRHELAELHCIAPIANLTSIAALGILSHNRAARIEHEDVSSGLIQDRRKDRVVPDARSRPRKLHDYANVYVCGRNPMMYVLRGHHDELVLLRVSCDVLDLDGAIVADGNASSDWTEFHSGSDGLRWIDAEITFLGDPRHPSRYEFYDRKRRQCAEVLVPDCIPSRYIVGAYVSCKRSLERCVALGLPWPVTVDPERFFQ